MTPNVVARIALASLLVAANLCACGGSGVGAGQEPRQVTPSAHAPLPSLLLVRGGESGGIYLLAGGRETYLTEGGEVDIHSPTHRVAFTRGPVASDREICVGTLVRRVLEDVTCPTRGRSPAWSEDGRRLAFVDDGVRVLDLRNGSQTVVSVTHDGEPTWAPDGRHVFLTRSPRELVVLDTDGDASDDPMVINNVLAVAWNAHRGTLTLARGSPSGDATHFVEHSWPNETETHLFSVQGIVMDIAWTDDGRYLAYSMRPPSTNPESLRDQEIFVREVTSGATTRLTKNQVPDFGPVWVAR